VLCLPTRLHGSALARRSDGPRISCHCTGPTSRMVGVSRTFQTTAPLKLTIGRIPHEIRQLRNMWPHEHAVHRLAGKVADTSDGTIILAHGLV